MQDDVSRIEHLARAIVPRERTDVAKRGPLKRAVSRRPTRPGAILHAMQHDCDTLRHQLAEMDARVTRNRTDLDIQLRRIAELQAEVDHLRGRTKS